MKFNPETQYLGTLCNKGHDFEGTGLSPRFKNTTPKCVIYSCERKKAVRAELKIQRQLQKKAIVHKDPVTGFDIHCRYCKSTHIYPKRNKNYPNGDYGKKFLCGDCDQEFSFVFGYDRGLRRIRSNTRSLKKYYARTQAQPMPQPKVEKVIVTRNPIQIRREIIAAIKNESATITQIAKVVKVKPRLAQRILDDLIEEENSLITIDDKGYYSYAEIQFEPIERRRSG